MPVRNSTKSNASTNLMNTCDNVKKIFLTLSKPSVLIDESDIEQQQGQGIRILTP